MLSLVSSFSCGSREGSRCSLCVAHSNFGPKRASNSGRIYSSNKINIQSCPLDLARRLAFQKKETGSGVEGSGSVVQKPFLLQCLHRWLCNFSSTWVQNPFGLLPSFVYITFGRVLQGCRLFSSLPDLKEVGAFEKSKRPWFVSSLSLCAGCLPKYV